jgi:hypothetical protein
MVAAARLAAVPSSVLLKKPAYPLFLSDFADRGDLGMEN